MLQRGTTGSIGIFSQFAVGEVLHAGSMRNIVEQVTQIVLQFWFWLTPIVYVNGALPRAFASA